MKKLVVCCVWLMICVLHLNSKTQGNRHIVKRGETLYSVAKVYKVSISELAKANSFSTKHQIKIGEHLLIPVKSGKQQAITYKRVSVPSTPDTPYREEDVHPHTSLYVPKEVAVEKPRELPSEPKHVEGLKTTSSNATEYPEIFDQYAVHGYKIKRNRGEANYLPDATSGNQNLAFYNDTETGSVIRVTNLMNQKTIFVKVIGKVPPADTGSEIVVKLSNKAAKDLEVTDTKFLVEVASYSSN